MVGAYRGIRQLHPQIPSESLIKHIIQRHTVPFFSKSIICSRRCAFPLYYQEKASWEAETVWVVTLLTENHQHHLHDKQYHHHYLCKQRHHHQVVNSGNFVDLLECIDRQGAPMFQTPFYTVTSVH